MRLRGRCRSQPKQRPWRRCAGLATSFGPGDIELLERSELLEALARVFVAAADGRGRLVLLGGEAGAGKTAPLRAFCTEGALPSARVFWLARVSACSRRVRSGRSWILPKRPGSSWEVTTRIHGCRTILSARWSLSSGATTSALWWWRMCMGRAHCPAGVPFAPRSGQHTSGHSGSRGCRSLVPAAAGSSPPPDRARVCIDVVGNPVGDQAGVSVVSSIPAWLTDPPCRSTLLHPFAGAARTGGPREASAGPVSTSDALGPNLRPCAVGRPGNADCRGGPSLGRIDPMVG